MNHVNYAIRSADCDLELCIPKRDLVVRSNIVSSSFDNVSINGGMKQISSNNYFFTILPTRMIDVIRDDCAGATLILIILAVPP